MDDAALVDRLENRLMSYGVYLERTARDGDALHLEYETAAGGIPDDEVGRVCSELVDAHRSGWRPLDVRAWAFDLDGRFLGRWAVSAGWFRALDRGDVSETDFSTLVLSTRSTDPHGPDAPDPR